MDADEVAVRFSVTFIYLLLLACPDDSGHDYRWSVDDFADVLVELGMIELHTYVFHVFPWKIGSYGNESGVFRVLELTLLAFQSSAKDLEMCSLKGVSHLKKVFTPLATVSKSSVISAEKTTLKKFAKGRKPVVKESPRLFKAPAGDQKAENRLGCIKQTMRRQNALGRNSSKKNLKNIQVLAAASLHRQPGLKKVLTAMTLYRKDCAAGIVKLSPSDAFKVAKLQWMV